jgi:hypothetical protein
LGGAGAACGGRISSGCARRHEEKSWLSGPDHPTADDDFSVGVCQPGCHPVGAFNATTGQGGSKLCLLKLRSVSGEAGHCRPRSRTAVKHCWQQPADVILLSAVASRGTCRRRRPMAARLAGRPTNFYTHWVLGYGLCICRGFRQDNASVYTN